MRFLLLVSYYICWMPTLLARITKDTRWANIRTKGARRFAAAEISNISWGDQVTKSFCLCYALVVPLWTCIYGLIQIVDATGFGAPCLQNPLQDVNEHPKPEAPAPSLHSKSTTHFVCGPLSIYACSRCVCRWGLPIRVRSLYAFILRISYACTVLRNTEEVYEIYWMND